MNVNKTAVGSFIDMYYTPNIAEYSTQIDININLGIYKLQIRQRVNHAQRNIPYKWRQFAP